MPNLVSLICLGLQISGKTQTAVSEFQIPGQSLIKENCHNSRTCDDIDTKLGLVTKLDKTNKTTSKKFDDDVISKNCDAINIFPIYGQFGAIRKPRRGGGGAFHFVEIFHLVEITTLLHVIVMLEEKIIEND